MSFETHRSALFEELAGLLRACAGRLDVTVDEPGHLSIDTFHVMKNGKPLFFGAVKTGKRYVSYHLMPVYVEPALLSGCSAELMQRLHGKSCFNFRQPDPERFRELAALTGRGLEDYVHKGYVDGNHA